MTKTIIPVLIADPHRQSRDLLMSTFQALGLRYVWSSETAERTKNFLDAVIFDYVLLDSQLSGTRLNTFIESIRNVSNHTKIVVLSHLPHASDRYPDADMVVTKPVTFNTVQQLLSQNQSTFMS